MVLKEYENSGTEWVKIGEWKGLSSDQVESIISEFGGETKKFILEDDNVVLPIETPACDEGKDIQS